MNKKIMPRRLYEKACEIRERATEPVTDYKDSAALWSRAIGEAANILGCTDVLIKLGMPDGLMCPRAFDKWCGDVIIEPPSPEIALTELQVGLKYANADVAPEWCNMGDTAMSAMAEYPPWVEWEKSHDEDAVYMYGDDIRLKMAMTVEFRDFLVKWVNECRKACPTTGKEG